MYWLLALMTLSLVGLIVMGVFFHMKPPSGEERLRRWLIGTVGVNLLVFLGALLGLVFLGIEDAMAQTGGGDGLRDLSVGTGLAMIGIGIPTAVATIGAGMAVGPVGAASLAVIAEKPEIFGRTLVYLGLAEGIAIYGLVVTILMLGRL